MTANKARKKQVRQYQQLAGEGKYTKAKRAVDGVTPATKPSSGVTGRSLTAAQLDAIATIDSNLLIVACAGSGKTEVIAQRVARLLQLQGVEPKHIVAFTFTDKAAGELKARIHARVAEHVGEVRGMAEMYVGTMHGYALELLHGRVPEAFKYNVLNDVQARLLIDRYSQKSGLRTTTAIVQGAERPLKRYTDSRLYQQVMAVVREDRVDLAGLRPCVAEGLHKYRELLHGHSYYDFTEIIAEAVHHLELADASDQASASLRGFVRDTVKYVVVDEYQDTNPIQERLIGGLTQFGANLCVVGDDDQTIYQWRGSSVDNILTLERRYSDVKRVTLNENFRSSPAIVGIGRRIADSIPESTRLAKKMVAAGHQSFERGDVLALQFAELGEEAAWIADRIQALRGAPFTDSAGADARGLSWSDCAVLFRSVRNDAGPLVDELRRRSIPYVIKGLTGLFDTPEVVASVTCFKYMVGQATGDDVVTAWLDADLGLTKQKIRTGLAVLDGARRWDDGGRWDRTTLQATFQKFLEEMGLKEEGIPSASGPGRGELVFHNLGRFSTAIGDFEAIHLTTSPQERFTQFVNWVTYQAPSYYEESDGGNGFAQPDAVVIATVHQAKGMQWPAVFLPALRKNTFPSRRSGGLNVFHVVEPHLVTDPERYRGTVEDERRLFYVAVTRAQKYLVLSFAPSDKQTGRQPSEFFLETTKVPEVLTRATPVSPGGQLLPMPLSGTPNVVLSFSDLKYLFECRYGFKLRLLYGFDAPLQKELGYGKSLHDCMAEIHKRAIAGDILSPEHAEELVNRHLNLPYADPASYENLRPKAVDLVRRYLRENRELLPLTEFSEQVVQIHPVPGVTVTGRIDLTRRLDTGEVSIVDFKSKDRAQTEKVTFDQLNMYALGYQELTGGHADVIEMHTLDEGGSKREMIDPKALGDLATRVAAAADALRTNRLPRLTTWGDTCRRCDFVGLCRKREK